MDENSLMTVVYDHNTYLVTMLDDITKDIKYYKDLSLLNQSHSRSNGHVQELLRELNIKEKLVNEIIDNYTENMDNEGITIKEIEKEIDN